MRVLIRNRRIRNGFTLIEVVTSLSIMTVLMLGLSGAIMISSHAIPTAKDTGLADQKVIDALNQFRSDLRDAKFIQVWTEPNGNEKTKITFKDAGAKGMPGYVKYIYIPSDLEFKRRVETLTPEVLVTQVDSFTITVTTDGSDASVVSVLMGVDGTVQRFYEMHALMPDKPVNQ